MTLFHLQNRSLHVPDVEVVPSESLRYEAARGYGHILVVFDNNQAVGWIKVETLGFETTRNWLSAQ